MENYDDTVNVGLSVGTIVSPLRLVVGTGALRSLALLESSLVASEASIATVALRRV